MVVSSIQSVLCLHRLWATDSKRLKMHLLPIIAARSQFDHPGIFENQTVSADHSIDQNNNQAFPKTTKMNQGIVQGPTAPPTATSAAQAEDFDMEANGTATPVTHKALGRRHQNTRASSQVIKCCYCYTGNRQEEDSWCQCSTCGRWLHRDCAAIYDDEEWELTCNGELSVTCTEC